MLFMAMMTGKGAGLMLSSFTAEPQPRDKSLSPRKRLKGSPRKSPSPVKRSITPVRPVDDY
jgi:hypothetical protein